MVLEDLQQPPNGFKKGRSPESFEDSHSMLPTELIVEILLRLPVQSLLRFKSVSKRWFSLISDPSFVKSHLSLSTTNNQYARHRLITLSSHERIMISHLYDALCDNSINASELHHTFDDPEYYGGVVGSCNGLLCICSGNRPVIWNPSTRKSKILPFNMNRTSGHMKYGFGYEESTNDYKVVEIFSYRTFVDMYSLKTGQWKEISAFPTCIPSLRGSGMFFRGALHWFVWEISDSSDMILSLDLAKETFTKFSQPLYDEGDKHLILGALGEWLCVGCRYNRLRLDLWVMKGYGVEDSWTKLVSISCRTYYVSACLLSPPWIINDEKFLLLLGVKLIVYDLKNGSYSEIQTSYQCYSACICVESLVSLDAPSTSRT